MLAEWSHRSAGICIQADHVLGDGIQTVFQNGGKLSGSMLLSESIFLSQGPDFPEEVFLVRDAVPEGLL